MQIATGAELPSSAPPAQPDVMGTQDFTPHAIPRGELKINTRLQ